MRKTAISIALGLLLVLGATPVLADAIPKLPHAFYGSVTVNGAPAPDGTQVSATVNIGSIIATQNPVTTTGGNYGIGSPYLLVQGYDIPDDATITFHVTTALGTVTGGTAAFIQGGGPTQLDIVIAIVAPPPPPPPTIEASFFGDTTTVTIDSSGIVQETAEFTSPTGELTITIPEGTMALDEEGEPLTGLTAETMDDPPPPPEDGTVIGLAYDFGPDGATFDPPLSLTFTYDPDSLPEGVSEEDLVIAFYDEDAAEWVNLVCVVNTDTNTITASVSHFGCFSLMVITPPVFEEEPPVSAEKEPPAVEEEEPPVVEEEEPPVVEEEEPPVVEEEEPLMEEEPSGLNWPVIGGIIGGVLLIAALGFLWYRRRAYS